MEHAAVSVPSVRAAIVDGPIERGIEVDLFSDVPSVDRQGNVGALLRFEGVVRLNEADPAQGCVPRPLVGLDYQTYDPMALREFEALARVVAERHGLLWIVALHSRGRVAVGGVSFVLTVAGVHRAEAIAGLTEFIDRLKLEVPIWKRPVWK